MTLLLGPSRAAPSGIFHRDGWGTKKDPATFKSVTSGMASQVRGYTRRVEEECVSNTPVQEVASSEANAPGQLWLRRGASIGRKICATMKAHHTVNMPMRKRISASCRKCISATDYYKY